MKTICSVEDRDEVCEVWRSAQIADRTLLHFGGHLFWPLADSAISEYYWIIPEPFWASAEVRERLVSRIEREHRLNIQTTEKNDHSVKLTLPNLTITICTLANLSRFHSSAPITPAVVNIDLSYFVTRDPDDTLAYFQKKPITPWITLSRFWVYFQAARLNFDVLTLCSSVSYGFTPVEYKYFSENLRHALVTPDTIPSDVPAPNSAAAYYLTVVEILRQKDRSRLDELKVAWREMVKRDSFYRSELAIGANSAETLGDWKEALRIYDLMIEVEPQWACLHMGRGRSLANLDRWTAAASAFLSAARLTPRLNEALTYWLGQCAHHHDDDESAKAYWQIALEENPEHTPSLLALKAIDKYNDKFN